VINGGSFGLFGIFNTLPIITLPIFNMGRLQAEVQQAEARTQEAIERYQQTIQQEFREVSDGLVEQRKRRETRLQQERLTRTLLDMSQWPIFDMKEEFPATWRRRTPSGSSSLPNWTWRRPSRMNWPPPSGATRPWAEAGRARRRPHPECKM
jgi:hypothetical protein